jgi:hypothetical protein
MEKVCQMCGELKSYQQFSINRTSKDGLQRHCKICSQKESKKFREKNKDYYWGNNGYFRQFYEATKKYNQKYYNAIYSVKIYCIELPDGFYVGCTKTRLNVRMKDHLGDYRHYKLFGGKKKMPIFYDALDRYTLDEVKDFIRNVKLLEEFEGTHEEKRNRETYWIQLLKKSGKTMLNKWKVNLEKTK